MLSVNRTSLPLGDSLSGAGAGGGLAVALVLFRPFAGAMVVMFGDRGEATPFDSLPTFHQRTCSIFDMSPVLGHIPLDNVFEL